MKIIFFDIDGTLINTGGSGVTALKAAFAEVFSVPAPEKVHISGRTDRGILRDFFLSHGIEDSEFNWRQYCDAYHANLERELPRREGRVLPGVVELLRRLSLREDLALGLLTGNTRGGAWLKLSYFEIFDHFSFGGFGEDHLDRNAVARDALRAGREHLGQEIPVERVFVIGDTPLDVRCARHIGARAIAVATGFHPAEELAAEQPDLLLENLQQTAELLALIDG